MADSLWLADRPLPTYPTLDDRREYDVVVVGGGLTGLVTALLLVRSGATVAVIEARRIGAGTTGNTTAKVSLLQGSRLSTLARTNPRPVVQAYVDANVRGQAWLQRYCEERAVPTQTRPAITYATSEDGERVARAELACAREAGLDVGWESELSLPYRTRGGVVLGEQMQLNPMDVLAALATDVEAGGGAIAEQTRVRDVHRGNDNCTVLTEHGKVTAGRVVLATGTPILDRGGFFARLEPLRSYAAAFEVPGPAPAGMYICADQPTRSLRTTPHGGSELLLVGGNGHVVGRHPSPASLVQDLTTWTEEHFPGARRTHWWSAQDYASLDGLPYVGPLLPGHEQVLVATGYAKWGMTNAVAAALVLSGQALDDDSDWTDRLRSWRWGELGGLWQAARLNGAVAGRMAEGWLRAAVSGDDDGAPAEGQGRVVRRGTKPVATCTVNGQTQKMSAVCPHLGGVVTWNDAELSWDCPLHGSRFSATGALLEGPAGRGLAPRGEFIAG